MNAQLTIALLVSVAWTALFSLSSTPGIRGYRNLGILAAYISVFVYAFRSPWVEVLSTWVAFALFGGISYTASEIIQRVRAVNADEKPGIGYLHVFPALVIWPVMLPEAIEYSLAALGVLKSKP